MAASQMQCTDAKRTDVEDASEECTMMLRGIACRLTQEDVKEILDDVGLRGKFSYVYVPRIVARNSNLGYAFVRFRTMDYAVECHAKCHSRPLGPSAEGKVCEVVVAKAQGDDVAIHGKRRRKQNGQVPDILLCHDAIPEPQAAQGSQPTAASPGSRAASGPPATATVWQQRQQQQPRWQQQWWQQHQHQQQRDLQHQRGRLICAPGLQIADGLQRPGFPEQATASSAPKLCTMPGYSPRSSQRASSTCSSASPAWHTSDASEPSASSATDLFEDRPCFAAEFCSTSVADLFEDGDIEDIEQVCSSLAFDGGLVAGLRGGSTTFPLSL